MFRNQNGSNRHMSSSFSSENTQRNENDNILYNIVTNNYENIVNLVNSNNINNVIDTKNKYTALHYAVILNNQKLVEYFLNLEPDLHFGSKSNPPQHFGLTTKDNGVVDIYDLAIKYQNKFIIEYYLKKKSDKITELAKNIGDLNKKVLDVEANNKYLLSNVDKTNNIVRLLKQEIAELKTELSSTKKRLVESNNDYTKMCKNYSDINTKYEKANSDLYNLKNNHNELKTSFQESENEVKTLKRKLSEEQEAYTGLLSSIKKNKNN